MFFILSLIRLRQTTQEGRTARQRAAETSAMDKTKDKLRQLEDEFFRQCTAVTKQLESILSDLPDGSVPSQEAEAELYKGFHSLRKTHQQFYTEARSMLGDDSTVSPETSMRELREALQNVWTKQRVEEVCAVLDNFSQVLCVQDQYTPAIKPYQDETQQLAARLRDGAQELTDEVLASTEGPALFLRALTLDPASAEYRKIASEDLAPYYSADVRIGFFTGAYKLASRDIQIPGIAPEQKEPEDAQPEAPAVINELPSEQTMDSPSDASEEDTRSAPQSPVLAVEVSPAPAPEKEALTARFTHPETTEYIKAVNKPRPGTMASASAFKKGLREVGRIFHELPSLIQLMGTLGATTPDALLEIGRHAGALVESDDEAVAAVLDQLARKGWVARYEYEENGEQRTVFALSEFTAVSMRKDSVAGLLRRISSLHGCHACGYSASEDRDDVLRTVHDADALVYYLNNCDDELRSMVFGGDRPGVTWTTVADWFQYCTVYVETADHQRIACQLVHSGSDPEKLLLRNALYIQMPGEEAPSDEWLDAVKGTFAHFTDGVLRFTTMDSKENGTDDDGRPVHTGPDSGRMTLTLDGGQKLQIVARRVTEIPADAAPNAAEATSDESEADAPAAAPRLPLKRASRKRVSSDLPASAKTSRKRMAHQMLGKQQQVREVLQPVDAPVEALSQPASTPEIQDPAGGLDAVLHAASAWADAPSDMVFHDAAMRLLKDPPNSVSPAPHAVLLSKSAALVPGNTLSDRLSSQMQLATRIVLDDIPYSSAGLDAVFPEPENADSSLLYCAYAFALLSPSAPNDYLLRTRARDLFNRYETFFPQLPEFKVLFRTLLDLWQNTTTGFSPSAMALLGDNSQSEQYVQHLTNRAKDFMHVVPPTTKLKPLVPTHNAAFGPGSDLYSCMSIIARDGRHKRSHVERILERFCDPSNPASLTLSDELIEEDLMQKWEKASSKNFSLAYVARDKEMRCYKDRLELMVAWVRHIRTLESWPKEMAVLKKMRSRIGRDLDQIERKKTWQDKPHSTLMQHFVTTMKEHLAGTKDDSRVFEDILKTGRFWLDEDGRPIIDAELAQVPFFEPWRQTALHLQALQNNPGRTFEDVRDEILDVTPGGPEGMMDNLHQLDTMRRILGKDAPEAEVTDELREATIDAAGESRRELEEELDIAYALGLLNADEKRRISETIENFEEMFFQKGDFAMWRWFLAALSRQIAKSGDQRIESGLAHLRALRENGNDSAMLERAEKALTEDRNFTIAEEYLNRHESGEFEWMPMEASQLGETSFFEDFRTQSVFQPLLDECRRNGEGTGSPLKSFGTKYVQEHKPADWTARHTADSASFLAAWPGGKGTPPEQVKNFLVSLGIDATEAVLRRQKGNVEVFEVQANPVPRGKKDYTHPIAAFGTRMEPSLNVVAIYGKCIEDQLVETMRELDFDDISLVLLDYHMDPGQRRRLAEIFHRQTQGQNRYLVIDRVLALYLAFRKRTERLKAMLQCTLPYTACQPFGSDGGATPDEMFCGRESELASIISPDGASIVYGGRQLGKTALLQRAQSRFHAPAKRHFALYTNIQRCDSADRLAERLSSDIRAMTGDAVQLSDTSSLEDLCTQLEREFREGRIASMLLLMDEADPFLKAISEDCYRDLQPLVELRQATQNKFKFVLAGLHNVCRAERAMANNGVFGQLGTPLCVRPLTRAEASRLLERPLRYLGFEIPARQLETLITNSNFYPGVLQFIGYMLAETLPDHYKKAYYSAVNNPPFGLDDSLLGTVLKSRDLNASIQSKVRATLELDPRYFMIARAIALLSCLDEDAAAQGYTAQSIRDTAADYNVSCLANESAASFATLLDEMVDMGLLVSQDGTRYRFRRDTFKDIVGTDADALEEALRSEVVPT